MECPFVEVGCNATKTLTASSYQKHLSENIEGHLEMVTNLHQRNLGCNVLSTSALGKLNAINHEVGFLDSILQQYEMNLLPSLGCIKTLLALPDVWLRQLGDTCSFRMPNYSVKRSRKSKWLSPPFFVQGGYKMRVCVYANGVNAGASSHISVTLLLFSDMKPPDFPISLPPNVGMKVELLHDDPDFETDDHATTKNSEVLGELTWTPKNNAVEAESMTRTEPQTTGSLPSLPPDIDQATNATQPGPKSEETGITLITSEKFAALVVAENCAQTYNSLVFQVALCLV